MAPRWRCAWTALAVTAITATGTAGDAPAFRVRISGSRHAQSIERALSSAHERLGRPECQKLFTDFNDTEGRPLQERLDTLALSGPDFLQYVGFYEGYGKARCQRAQVMAFTQPGSLAVRVCPQISREPQDVVELILIHEMLHSLGLGENPPSTYAITEQVRKRCGGSGHAVSVRTATR